MPIKGDVTSDANPTARLSAEQMQMRAGEAAASALYAEARRSRDHTRLAAQLADLGEQGADWQMGFIERLCQLAVQPPPMLMPLAD